MHKTFWIPYHHDEDHKVGVGFFKYKLNGPENDDVMEMVIILPDEKHGLTLLEVELLNKFIY